MQSKSAAGTDDEATYRDLYQGESMDVIGTACASGRQSPFSRLNDDILARFFLWQADIERPSYPRRDQHDPFTPVTKGCIGWIRLTHVSRRWRYIGLNICTLWARDICVFPHAFNVFLKRARHAPLTITQEVDIREDQLMFLAQEPKRLRSLVSRRSAPCWPLILPGRKVPHLRSLELHGARPGPLVLPVHAPMTALRLEAVVFNNIIIHFIAPRLRSLYLSVCTDDENFLNHILDVLEGCPLLQTIDLRVRSTDEDLQYNACAYSRSIRLEYVEKLQLVSYDRPVYHILRHLYLPSHATIDVLTFGPLPRSCTPTFYFDVLDSLRSHLLPTFNHLSFRRQQGYTTNAGFALRSIKHPSSSVSFHHTGYLQSRERNRSPDIFVLMTALSAFLTAGQIQSFDISDVASFPGLPAGIHSAVNSATTLSFSDKGLGHFIGRFDSPSCHTLFPNLRTLVLADKMPPLHLSALLTVAGFEMSQRKEMWDALVQFLASRLRAGQQLHTLRLERQACNVPQHHVSEWQGPIRSIEEAGMEATRALVKEWTDVRWS